MEEIYAAVQFAVSRLLNITALKSIFLKLFRAHVTAAARVDFIIDDHDEIQQQPKKQIRLNLFQSWTDEVKWNRSWAKASSSRKRMCYLNIWSRRRLNPNYWCFRHRSHFIYISLLKMSDRFYTFKLRESMRRTLRWRQRGSIPQLIKLILCWYIPLISDSHHCWALSCPTHKHHRSSVNHRPPIAHPGLGCPRSPLMWRVKRGTEDTTNISFHFHQRRLSSKLCHGQWWRLAADK